MEVEVLRTVVDGDLLRGIYCGEPPVGAGCDGWVAWRVACYRKISRRGCYRELSWVFGCCWGRPICPLAKVLSTLGTGYFEHVLPDIIQNCSHQKASMRDGYLTLFKYLPRSLGVQFQNYLQQVLPANLDGSLADENESVRDAALGAGHVLVEHYATTSLPLLLPTVEDGIFNDNWRIRQSSVELLGDLLFKVAGTSGKSDEGSCTEAHGRAIVEVLGRDKRNEILAALYMVRTDVSLSVRQAALHVWKTIVANTPKTLKEIMPVVARALGELVRKLGERDTSFDHPNPIPDAKGS
ncbi:translational activator GCN1 [Populus alba x Populus x berolinensis]|nr:translational activator GCN1 [Populus alba x Populus x berolinensis]